MKLRHSTTSGLPVSTEEFFNVHLSKQTTVNDFDGNPEQLQKPIDEMPFNLNTS